MKNILIKLNSCNLKATPQRLAIYALLASTDKHPGAEAIYRQLRETHPAISLATVYRTLDIFKRAGIIQELNFGEDNFRYDANVKPHAHLICQDCGAILDVLPSEAVNNAIDTLKYELAIQEAFKIQRGHIFFSGTCAECQKQN